MMKLQKKKGGEDDIIVHIHGEKEYEKLKGTAGKLVVVAFAAEWCVPCKKVVPELERMAQKYRNEVVFLHVDIDENSTISKGVAVTPTFKLFRDGKLLMEFSGSKAEDIEAKIVKCLSFILN